MSNVKLFKITYLAGPDGTVEFTKYETAPTAQDAETYFTCSRLSSDGLVILKVEEVA